MTSPSQKALLNLGERILGELQLHRTGGSWMHAEIGLRKREPFPMVLEVSCAGVEIRLAFACTVAKAVTGVPWLVQRLLSRPKDADFVLLLSDQGFTWAAYQFGRNHGAEVLLLKEAACVNWPAYIAAIRLRKLNAGIVQAGCLDVFGEGIGGSEVAEPESVHQAGSLLGSCWSAFATRVLRSPAVVAELMRLRSGCGGAGTCFAEIDLKSNSFPYEYGIVESSTRLAGVRFRVWVGKPSRHLVVPAGPFMSAPRLPVVVDPSVPLPADTVIHTRICAPPFEQGRLRNCTGHLVFGNDPRGDVEGSRASTASVLPEHSQNKLG